jgi:lysophospholipase L1-like esterase
VSQSINIIPTQVNSITGQSVFLLGDSITSHNVAIGCNATFCTYENLPEGYFTWLNAFAIGSFSFAGIASSGGKTAAWGVSELPVVLQSNAQWAFNLFGTNDLAGAVATATLEANLLTIYTTELAAGIKPVAVTIPPTSGTPNAAYIQSWSLVNAWIKQLPSVLPGVVVLDPWSPCMSSTGTYPVYSAGMSDDGTHPNQVCAYLAGQLAATQLSGKYNLTSILPIWSGDVSNQAGANPSFQQGTSGTKDTGVTGSATTGTVIYTTNTDGSSCVASKGTRSDGFGATQILTLTGVSSTSSCVQTASAAITAAVGDVIIPVVEIMSATVQYQLAIEGQTNTSSGSPSHYYYFPNNILSQSTTALNETISTPIVFRGQPFVVPPNLSYMSVAVWLYGTTGTVTIGRLGLIDITPH